MVSVENNPGMWGREGWRTVEEVNLSMIYLINYKNFSNYHNVPPPSRTIKIKDIKNWKLKLKK
jgi:hypothetical protein